MRRLVTLGAMILPSGCGAAISERSCPLVTELPAEVQRRAAVELANAPTLARMTDTSATDCAFIRAIHQ
jgi:hypothetical protein